MFWKKLSYDNIKIKKQQQGFILSLDNTVLGNHKRGDGGGGGGGEGFKLPLPAFLGSKSFQYFPNLINSLIFWYLN